MDPGRRPARRPRLNPAARRIPMNPAAMSAPRLLEAFFEHSLDLHVVADAHGHLLRVNPAWREVLGYELDGLVGQALADLIHPDDRARFVENFGVLPDGDDVTAFEARCLTQSGEPHWILWNATSLPEEGVVLATGRDITRRKLAEAAVQKSEEHYRDLFHQSYQMQENLRRMSDRVLKVQEHERTRISRDLHDEVGQALTAVNLNLAMIRNALGDPTPEISQRLTDSQHLIEQTMANIHNFSRELRPAMLDDLGLVPALRNYVKSFSARTGLAVKLDTTQSEHVEQLDAARKMVVYRIVQEGLTNVVKHAEAHHVDIIITGSAHDVRVQLSDDGRGFVPGAQPDVPNPRLGLLGLAERVRLVGGEFSPSSAPAHGTVLRATIPFKTV